ncbi:MAG TPA: SDR family NAD(P)-dependent oxidoreductase [Acidimicrobiales bacterium]|nr:SDR family NAD(P)-dependent oxidoreductase [Acidimicrobiales bacterium]
MNTLLAHAEGSSSFWNGFTEFGALWLVPAPIVLLLVGGAAVLWLLGTGRGLLARVGDGAARMTGLPDWVAVPVLTMLAGALPMAALGFYWDVAWHIDEGRDEFLFSPPHVALAGGLALIGVAGVLGILLATRAQPTTGWSIGRWRVPLGAGALALAGAASMVAFGADEIWHRLYGLDVSMWGPTHLTMVSAAAFSPFAVWLLLGEAGPGAGRPVPVTAIKIAFAAALMVALSAWQLEFDLGVPQWQALYHPVLIVAAAGLGLTSARTILGPGGALLTAIGTIVIRGAFTSVVAGLGMTTPRFPLYLGAALAVEAAAALAGKRSTVRHGLIAGLGVATVGLAGAWAWTHAWGYRPWQPSLFPELWVAVVVALAASVLGVAVGRIVSHRPSGLRTPAVVACFVGLALGVVVPFPRNAPDAEVVVRTTAAGPGLVDVEVVADDPSLGQGIDWFEVFSWQGGGSRHAPLLQGADGVYRAEHAMPVGGTWKTMITFADGDRRGVVPLFFPADPAIDASEVPVVAERRSRFTSEQAALQRERHDGPAWPAVFGYLWVAGSIFSLIGILVAGYVALERRRRAGTWPPPGNDPGPLDGTRVVVTGAAGGIGRAVTSALQANGARVVGIDRADADLTDAGAAEQAVRAAAEKLGGIDVLVNNAGLGTAGDSGAAPDERAQATVAVNLFGAWNATAAAMPYLLEARGHVVNVASGLAVATVPYAAAYAASKRAVLAYGDTLRMEYRGRVAVSAVLPGYIRTSIHAGPAADGVSLDGVIPDEPVEAAAAAIVAAIETRRRTVMSSPLTHVRVAAARWLPRTAERVIARRVQRRRLAPAFVRFPEPSGS